MIFGLLFYIYSCLSSSKLFRKFRKRTFKPEHTHKLLWTSVVGALSVIMLILVFYNYENRRKIKEIERKDKEISGVNLLLGEREGKLKQMTERLETLNKEYEEREKEVTLRAARLEELLKMTVAGEDGPQNDIVRKFKAAAKDSQIEIEDRDWRRILKKVEQMYPGLVAQTQMRIPRSGKETLRTCCLVKLGFSNTEITVIMKTPRQTVWYRVNLLKKRLGDLLDTSPTVL